MEGFPSPRRSTYRDPIIRIGGDGPASVTDWDRFLAAPVVCVLGRRVGDDADVRLWRLPIAEQLLRFLVLHRAGDDDVLAAFPVHRRGDLVLGGQLQRVD